MAPDQETSAAGGVPRRVNRHRLSLSERNHVAIGELPADRYRVVVPRVGVYRDTERPHGYPVRGGSIPMRR